MARQLWCCITSRVPEKKKWISMFSLVRGLSGWCARQGMSEACGLMNLSQSSTRR